MEWREREESRGTGTRPPTDRWCSVNQLEIETTVLLLSRRFVVGYVPFGRDIPPSFEKPFANVIYDNNNLSSFKPYYSVNETTELAEIQPPAFSPID